MKLLFTIVAVLISLPSFLCGTIAPFDSIVDELNYIGEEYADLCNGYNVTLHLFNENSIRNNLISSPTLRCLSIENSGVTSIEDGAFIHLPNLQYLSLQGNAIPQENLFAFGNLSNVKKLILSNQNNWYNSETTVRGVYPQLEYLDLKNIKTHRITSQQENPFPNLTHLDLSWNKIENFDFMSVLPERLTYLYLNNNAISRISLMELSNLSLLTLDDNAIEVIGSNYGLSLTGATNLRNLSVKNNRISSIQEEAFKDTVKLQYLDISVNSLSVIGSEVFDYLSSLTVLVLDGNMLTEIPAATTQRQLRLTSLSMNCNRIQHLSTNALFSLPNLRTLSLSGNMISQINPNTFQRQYKLEELYLNDNELSHLSYNWCTTMDNLRYLNLEGNKFTSFESMHLATAPSLRQVYISRNFIKYINATSIKTLPENTTIYFESDYTHNISNCKHDRTFLLE